MGFRIPSLALQSYATQMEMPFCLLHWQFWQPVQVTDGAEATQFWPFVGQHALGH